MVTSLCREPDGGVARGSATIAVKVAAGTSRVVCACVAVPTVAMRRKPNNTVRRRGLDLIKAPACCLDSPGRDWVIGLGVCSVRGSHIRTQIGRATSELQSLAYLVCRLLLEKKK